MSNKRFDETPTQESAGSHQVEVDSVQALVEWARERGMSEEDFSHLIFTMTGVLAEHMLADEDENVSFGMVIRHVAMKKAMRVTCDPMTDEELEFHIRQMKQSQQVTEH